MNARWSWSAFGAGNFGRGLVLVRGEAAARVWLPRVGTEHDTDFRELRRLLQEYAPVAASEGEAAATLAARLEGSFLRGDDLSDIPFVHPSVTPFRLGVLLACHAIPRGQTCSYRELAAAVGSPGATRAVGTVMATNPLPLLVPCHRVCRSDGNTGTYGGGERMKRHLLEMEGALLGVH